MPQLDYAAFDADNHYYEAEDAFIRHMPKALRKRGMQWAEIDGKKRLLVGGKLNRFIPNPTFDPVAVPGCLDEFFRGRNPKGQSPIELFGRLEPIRPEYRDRKARLARLDAQGLEGAFLFPTLGVGMEESLKHDPEALVAAFSAFNRWLDEDWGYAFKDRLFAAPIITLVDVESAVAELRRALERDVRLVCLRAAPVATPDHSRSLGDPRHDPFWSLAAREGVLVSFHSGDSGYYRYAAAWGEGEEFKSFDFQPLRVCLSAHPTHDAMAALICHAVFARHPNLRVATIESGSEWVAPLLCKLHKAHGQMPGAFAEDPVETFKRHVWVSPYYEDDLPGLRETIGAERILLGSDWPHAEGLADPLSFVQDLTGFPPGDIRLVMRENALALSRRRPA
jgi:predicted TIM-barrel fold metal-dependent hydrolase